MCREPTHRDPLPGVSPHHGLTLGGGGGRGAIVGVCTRGRGQALGRICIRRRRASPGGGCLHWGVGIKPLGGLLRRRRFRAAAAGKRRTPDPRSSLPRPAVPVPHPGAAPASSAPTSRSAPRAGPRPMVPFPSPAGSVSYPPAPAPPGNRRRGPGYAASRAAAAGGR